MQLSSVFSNISKLYCHISLKSRQVRACDSYTHLVKNSSAQGEVRLGVGGEYGSSTRSAVLGAGGIGVQSI